MVAGVPWASQMAPGQWPPSGIKWEGDLTFILGRRPGPGLGHWIQWHAEVLWCPGRNPFFKYNLLILLSSQNFWWPFLLLLHKYTTFVSFLIKTYNNDLFFFFLLIYRKSFFPWPFGCPPAECPGLGLPSHPLCMPLTESKTSLPTFLRCKLSVPFPLERWTNGHGRQNQGKAMANHPCQRAKKTIMNHIGEGQDGRYCSKSWQHKVTR